ncbi:MAG: PLP-dependent cysteine synthase family protein [Candidatus Hodarchaeales archaeon]
MIVFVSNINQNLKKHHHPPQLHLIGNTPLLEITDISIFSNFDDVRVFAKLEMLNLGGSVKDRPALYMIEAAESSGIFDGKEILEPSSGNTGIGLAWIGKLKGLDVCIIMPENATKERVDILEALGARIILTPAEEGMDGSILKARTLVREQPERFIMLDQFSNEANWKANYYTTGPEIWEQTNGTVTHLIVGIGSAGTIMGVSRFLRTKNSKLKVIGIEPAENSSIPGLKNTRNSQIVPSILNKEELDQTIYVTDNEAKSMVKRLAKETSLLVGPSSGAALAGILKYCLYNDECISGNIVTVFPDGGLKYLSQNVLT